MKMKSPFYPDATGNGVTDPASPDYERSALEYPAMATTTSPNVRTRADEPGDEREAAARPAASPHALIWRFHFYVGVLVAPLLILSALTGTLYVFFPQIEELLYARLYNVRPVAGRPMLSYDDQLAAVRTAFPSAGLRTFAPSPSFSRSSAVSLTTATEHAGTDAVAADHGDHGGQSATKGSPSTPGAAPPRQEEPVTTVYVHPQTGQIVGSLAEKARFQTVLQNAHQSYLLGENGRILTELAASWLMVLLLTGFYLWFPRRASRIAGVWIPRLKTASSRLRWRDFHSILGVYALGITFVLSFTGITWTRFAGEYRRSFQKAIGQESAFRVKPPPSTAPSEAAASVSLATVAAAAERAGAAKPYRISLPRGRTGSFGVQTYDDPPFVESLTVFVDQYSGKVLQTSGRGTTPPIARFLSMGVALHEGQLFGLANQLLCASGAGMVLFSVVSGIVMWQKRRPAGGFGAPRVPSGVRVPPALAVGFGILCLLLPLVGVSFTLIWAFDRFVLPRLIARRRTAT